jgi:DNA-binding protein H-NS
MNELAKINQSIADLQKKAKLLMSEGRADVINDICSQMKAYGISIKEISVALKNPVKKNTGSSKAALKPAKKKADSVKVEAKYRGPEGQLWSGRGLSPKWLKTLEQAGQTKADFLIAPGQATPTATV